ncbi:nuclear transport factor 2 family protein [Tenacibaculum sp. SG-28]|uniref:nuclear transport factor 2 family protein n=1 Tax=Tenacibaculum sp. SG-28 TaxID=754426 RepID=UPI000CF4A38F|nr:nuclear transport factor 2 family protein [Tenacibaculum sp. SG-28]PQJ21718.1 hypothetical protein BSU00_06455 [Tenacibaculum sp. SG-28]
MKIVTLLLCLFLSNTTSFANKNTISYYRHLRFNHVSPHIDLAGIYPIDKETAKHTSHYRFTYDSANRIVEIINNHYHTERRHPLASLGVYKVVITYTDAKETRVFYDKNGKRISNDREVFKEVYTFQKNGFKTGLTFFDMANKPMESNWGISEYRWTKDKKMIVEKRFNRKGVAVSLSPYFQFETTGILLDKNGAPMAHYNLDQNLNVVPNAKGIAAYKDTYDENQNHIVYSYHDAKDNLVTNPWGFAYGKKKYDSIGNYIGLEQFDIHKTRIRVREIATNTNITLATKASKKDSLEIKRIALGYLKALQNLQPKLMEEVMNDSLKKVTIGWSRTLKKEVAVPTTKAQMLAFATSWNKANTKFPPQPNDQVRILDIYNRVANVKLISDNWVEYLHLIKLDGKWSIVNLLWQHKDLNRYPKE